MLVWLELKRQLTGYSININYRDKMMIIKRHLTAFLTLLISLGGFAQQQVPQNKMEEIYEKIKTPYKYGLVIAPTTNKYKVDCPSVFREGNKWYMTYLMYNGQNGKEIGRAHV